MRRAGGGGGVAGSATTGGALLTRRAALRADGDGRTIARRRGQVLAWVWRVTHVFEEAEAAARGGDGAVRVVEHLESWEISPLAGVLQVFRP